MNLCRLVYFSERNPAFDPDTHQIITVSQRNNAAADVTGLLFSDGAYFVQALEGRRSRVTRTYNRIANDTRHQSLYLVSCADVRERMFTGWSMALHTDMSQAVRDQMTSFFSLTSFDPENITVESLIYFLQILAMDLRRRDQKRVG
ncbi:MAG: BLUF domain-containing protein [Hyphomicrobiales bacterium]|nr:BLUF domain-containing protein [Hyphomicrobiales bacterium]